MSRMAARRLLIGAAVRQARSGAPAGPGAPAAAARRRAAMGRPRADPQPRHGLRLGRARRPQRRAAARAGGAGRRGPSALAAPRAPRCRRRLLHRHDGDRRGGRRADRGGRVSRRRGPAPAMRSARWRAATAISPSSPAPPVVDATAGAARRGRRGGPADGAQTCRLPGRRAPWTTRWTRSPGIWTRATTCTRPRAIGASWCAALRPRALIEEAASMPR